MALLLAFVLNAQQAAQHPIVQPGLNVIQGADNLEPFFRLLMMMEKQQVQQLSIFHIGDSHIQADLLTREVRKGMQSRFGNAGRGLVFPHGVAKTNGAPSVRSSATGYWDAGRNVQPIYRPRTGVAGFFLGTTTSNARLMLRVTNADSVEYPFNRLGIFRFSASNAYALNVGDSAKPYLYVNGNTPEIAPGFVSLKLPSKTNYVILENDRQYPMANYMSYSGFVLENGNPGILYHVAGVNGAQYGSYAQAPLFAPQSQALGAQLIIISLGTNEAFAPKFDSVQMLKDIDSLVTQLQNQNPAAVFILTTPPDCFKRVKYPQPNLPKMVDIIKQYAANNGLACWDMFEATGGYGSAKSWRKYGLMARDGVHFQKAGYALQGQLLLDALLNAYDNYKKSAKK